MEITKSPLDPIRPAPTGDVVGKKLTRRAIDMQVGGPVALVNPLPHPTPIPPVNAAADTARIEVWV